MKKSFGHTQLKRILRLLAVLTIKKYNPAIIGVTGTVGKTSTKEAVYAVVGKIRRTRRSSRNFNNEIGVPLTILGDWLEVGGLLFWCSVIMRAVINLLFRHEYPEVLVLEYAADRPGDIRYLTEIARPKIAIITAVGDIPVHVAFYQGGPEAVTREKACLIENVSASGYTVLNYDDDRVMGVMNRTRGRVMTFGFKSGAEVKVSSFENQTEQGRPAGISFKLEYGGSFIPIRMSGVYGRPPAYAAAAAATVGIILGMNLVRIAEALSYFEPPEQRMSLLLGLRGSIIFDDSYNAAPLSMKAAIETVRSFTAKRKVAIVGDMLELGSYTVQAHQEIGTLAGKVFDELITVGPGGKLMAIAAQKSGLSKKSIQSFASAEEARLSVRNLIKSGDLVLIKASRAMNLERIVEDLVKSKR